MKSEHTTDSALDFACRCGNRSTEPRLDDNEADVARRGFLRSAITGAVVGAIAGTAATSPRQAAAQDAPDASLKTMMDGNERYVSGQLKSLEEDLSILKTK